MANNILKVTQYIGVQFYEERSPFLPSLQTRSEKDYPKPNWRIGICPVQVKFRDVQVFIQFYSDYDEHIVQVLNARDNTLIEDALVTEVFDAQALGYKFYQFTVNGKRQPYDNIDYFYVTIQGQRTGGDKQSNRWISEPQKWAQGAVETEKGRALIGWRNSINYPDFYWQAGGFPYITLEAQIYRREPFTERTTYRDSRDRVRLLSSSKQNKVRFQLYNLAAYEQEILSFGLSLDNVFINGQEYVFEEGVETPEYRTRYQLSNVQALGTQGDQVLNICCDDPAASQDISPIVWSLDGGDFILTDSFGILAHEIQ